MNNWCFFCGGNELTASRKRRSVQFFQIQSFLYCRICRGYSLWPLLTQQQSKSMYSINYMKNVSLHGVLEDSNDALRFSEFLTYLRRNNLFSEIKCFLDYGCGADAKVLKLCEGLGIKSYGVELELSAREEAMRVSDAIVFSPEQMLSCGYKFDLVFLGDVLEHVNNPRQILDNVRIMLSSGGTVFIQGPLEGSGTLTNFFVQLKAIFLGRRPSLDPPYHVSLASYRSIKNLLIESKFEIIEISITEPRWPAKSLRSRDAYNSFSSFFLSLTKLIDIFISKIFRHYGSRFYCVARPMAE